MRISDWSSDVCSSDLHMKMHFLPRCQRPAAAPSPHHLPCKWFPPLPLTQERDSGGRPAAAASQRGFTLVELMVVIVIIGLLATVVMINVMPSQDRAMIEKARADVSTLEQAVETYRLEYLVYPRPDQALDEIGRAHV